jgi:hypothetical protein
MGDRHQRPARQLTGEHHGPGGRREHPLTWYSREIDAAVAGLPVR